MSTSVPLRTRRAYERASWPARGLTRARVLCASLLLLCVLVVAGWYLRVGHAWQPADSLTSMKLNGALTMAAVAGGHLTGRRRLRLALFGFAALVGVLVLTEYALGVSLGIDQLLIRDSSTLDGRVPGRPGTRPRPRWSA